MLGPIQIVTAADEVIDLPSASQRRLLAALALHAPRAVRAEWMCAVLDISQGALRTTVARMRRTVGDGVLRTTTTGYRLDCLVDAALACDELNRADGDPAMIDRALSRWTGATLEEFADEPWAVADVQRLEELRASGVEDFAEALIAHHRAGEAIAALTPHIASHPLRDRGRGLLVRALAAEGRQAEALRAYQHYRQYLIDTVGTEPSHDVRGIERRVAAGWNGVDPEHAETTDVGPGKQPTAQLPPTLGGAGGLVGRAREMSALVEAAANTIDAGPRVVLVTGEAGIGKTTLVAAFAREHCVPSGWTVLYGRCDEFVREPFQPFRGILGRIVDDLAPEDLVAHAASCGRDLATLVPQLEQLVPTVGRDVANDPRTARHLLFEAVVDVVRRTSARAPLMIVFDDVHWAEPTGVQLLRHLVHHVAGAPVLVVVSYRDTSDAQEGHLRAAAADLSRVGAVRIELGGLDQGELGDLVRARLGTSIDDDVASVAELLGAETAGNPLFAEQLLQHWNGSARLEMRQGQVRVSSLDLSQVPSTLRDLVWHRVSTLGPDMQPVLTAAAVLGEQFEEAVLGAMIGIGTRELAPLLDRAAAAGLVANDPTAPGTSRFAHALVAHALAAELGTRARTQLHADAFAALLRVPAAPSVRRPPRLAHHAACAGLVDEAQRWATAAADDALANLAPGEASVWFERALDHATTLGRPDAIRADLLVRLGEARYRAGNPTALDTLHEAAALAERCGADDVLIRAALIIDPGSLVRFGRFGPSQLAIAEAALAKVADDDRVTRARIMALLAQSLVYTDQAARRTEAATEALALARASGDRSLIARITPDLLMALWAPGRAASRSALAKEATEIVDELGDPGLSATLYYAAHTAAVCAGDAARARLCLDRLHSVAEDVGEPRARWMASIVDAFVATMAGEFAEAERVIAASFELGTEIGEPESWTIFAGQSFAVGTFAGRHAELLPLVQGVIDSQQSVELTFGIAHAIICVEVGQTEGPRQLLRQAVCDQFSAIPADLTGTTALLGYAVLALELEDTEAAAMLLPEILPLAGEVSFNGLTSQGPIAAYAGKLLSLLGDHSEAERYLLDALTVAESFGWQYHRATTLIALAQNRLRADGTLDRDGECWLRVAEELCATHGIESWAARAATLRSVHVSTR